MTAVYVFLADEGTPVWAPMGAEHVRGDIYRIVNDRGEQEGQFRVGDLVKCRPRLFENSETHLVACEMAE